MENDIEEQRELKQNFLKLHIVEQGFDTEQFTEFCHQKHEDGNLKEFRFILFLGTNIDIWSFREIKEVRIWFVI